MNVKVNVRTPQEILDRMNHGPSSLFGLSKCFLLEYLDVADDKKRFTAIMDEMREYMPFALDKAEHKRGLSAMRSMDHYRVWIWILRDEGEESLRSVYESNDDYGIAALQDIRMFYSF